ncbi:hypothetical protein PGTUg99_004326 [Puccinia graminis f. sp. tritici]|uniref:Uncharacterized protein n=1 Tax=Puccinia graminis f. sp. tritici TaxID=56615 RepID=A0A5B0MBH5_PUCGR|nr:hypothetical protein PGTUg99_004326 [Puccinia graminis f. sp. tritici]
MIEQIIQLLINVWDGLGLIELRLFLNQTCSTLVPSLNSAVERFCFKLDCVKPSLQRTSITNNTLSPTTPNKPPRSTTAEKKPASTASKGQGHQLGCSG